MFSVLKSKPGKGIQIVMGVLLVAGLLLLARKLADITTQEADAGVSSISGQEVSFNTIPAQRQPGQDCIIIDPGHGGMDSGKVGINGIYEKDINLQMAFLLKSALEQEGYYVIMTRDGDYGLYEDSASNTKVQDLKNRIRLIEETAPLLVISIHQNSYTAESIKGAQVFYYETSAEGNALADCIQNRMIQDVDPANHRVAKGNDTYYLLKKTPATTVIVECGFLSNYEEAELLCTEEYQEKMVNAITAGILDYVDIMKEG